MVARSLREAAALHQQLRRIVSQLPATAEAGIPAVLLAAAGEVTAAKGPLPTPPSAVLERLQKALAAGWADQVSVERILFYTCDYLCCAGD